VYLLLKVCQVGVSYSKRTSVEPLNGKILLNHVPMSALAKHACVEPLNGKILLNLVPMNALAKHASPRRNLTVPVGK
jgi:hypothetical protein